MTIFFVLHKILYKRVCNILNIARIHCDLRSTNVEIVLEVKPKIQLSQVHGVNITEVNVQSVLMAFVLIFGMREVSWGFLTTIKQEPSANCLQCSRMFVGDSLLKLYSLSKVKTLQLSARLKLRRCVRTGRIRF